ncbi:hypothetical protein HanRHA438_Chr02g0060551 [Helianthus annuus]|nr:hypothetical protein HanRHA438_Chr02g0060551 [Helianthus annuus]
MVFNCHSPMNGGDIGGGAGKEVVVDDGRSSTERSNRRRVARDKLISDLR